MDLGCCIWLILHLTYIDNYFSFQLSTLIYLYSLTRNYNGLSKYKFVQKQHYIDAIPLSMKQ